MDSVTTGEPLPVEAEAVVPLTNKQLQKQIKGVDSMKVLDALLADLEIDANVSEEDSAIRRAMIQKRTTALLRNTFSVKDNAEFKARVKAETRYQPLANLARKVHAARDKTRLSVVTKRIDEMQKSGQLKKKVRVPGTGERVEKTFVYNDSVQNKKLGRVGKEYKKWVWEGAEYVEEVRKVNKRRIHPIDEDGNKVATKRPKNRWILAIEQAKNEMGLTGLVIVRREAADREDEKQLIGEKVYKRAREIMDEGAAKAAEEVK